MQNSQKSHEITRREFLKYMISGTVVSLIAGPSALFGEELTLEEKLKANMESALTPLGGAWLSKCDFDIKSSIAGNYKVKLFLDKPDKESFRVVVYPELWEHNVDIEKVEVYLITPYQSRFEYRDMMVFLNKQDKRTNYVDTNMSYGSNLELLLDKTADLIFSVAKKLGINKSDVTELLSAIPGLFKDPSADAKAKQEAIEEGNLILKLPVYLKVITFDGNPNIGAMSRAHVKLYDLRIFEGEESIAVMMVKPKLYVYKDLNLLSGGFKIGGKITLQIHPDLYGKKKDYK